MLVEDECATYVGNFDYSYDNFGNNQTTISDDSNIFFKSFYVKDFMFVIKKFIDNFNKT